MTRYLVTGATGGLGRNAVHALLADGAEVRATGRDRHLGAMLRVVGAEFVALDLATADSDTMDSMMRGVDVVWHCAALTSPWGSRDAFVAANVHATGALVGAAAKAGVQRFVHVSSPIVYFNFEHRHQVREVDLAGTFVNAYAESKLRGEELVVRAGVRTGMRCVILRPRAIFGPHDRVLLPRLLRMHRACGGVLLLPRGGRARLDLTYVENVVQAMRLASTVTLSPAPHIYNISNGEPAELREVVKRLFKALGRNCRIVGVPYRAMAAAARLSELLANASRREPALSTYSVAALAYDLTLDISKARRELGYEPEVAFDDAIERTAAWLRNSDG